MIVAPAQKLRVLLDDKVDLVDPGAGFLRLGEIAGCLQLYLIENQHHKFASGYGAGYNEFNFTLSEDEAFQNLAAVIANLKKVKFHLLWFPTKGIEYVATDIYAKVVVRTAEYHHSEADEIFTRYDVLVQTLD